MANILVVDDARVMRNMLQAILTQHQHQVDMAEDGPQALALARQRDYDLVLTDLNMPEMNGISLLSKLRRIEHYRYTPILMITTETAEYRKNKARQFGATGWIAKPVTEERVINAVNKVLSRTEH